ncbi:MAG TPA: hypothetical protein VK843_07865 [Planctomycetota bacterium]|nr:hypothetical protein [Planctomycetota bacterium]
MRTLVLGLLLSWLPLPSAFSQDCGGISVGRLPLSDLGFGPYQGFQGGLYPGASNERPIAHEVAGLRQVAEVLPRSASGSIDMSDGKVGFISIGMSNCMVHFNAFMQSVAADERKSPQLVLANCAQSGKTAQVIMNPQAAYWTNWVPAHLASAGLSAEQVQVIWFLEAEANPILPFPVDALTLEAEFTLIMNILRDRFPNLRVCYMASRIYAGYATTTVNPEPWAYQQGFANKWLIEDQYRGNPALNFDPNQGPVVSPWITWGPYMWADGLNPRSDGLVWECSDFTSDGTHPSLQGAIKHAWYLMHFMHHDVTAQSWYLAEPLPVAYGHGKTTSIGTTPKVSWTGPASLAADQFRVELEGGVPGRVVIGLWSDKAASAPFLGGTLYLGAPIHRLPGQVLDANGSTSYAIQLVPPLLGATRNYQFWFRDPQQLDGTGAGLSDALQVRFFE